MCVKRDHRAQGRRRRDLPLGALQLQFSSFPEEPSCFLPSQSPGPQGYWEQKGIVSKYLKFLLRSFVPSRFVDFRGQRKYQSQAWSLPITQSDLKDSWYPAEHPTLPAIRHQLMLQALPTALGPEWNCVFFYLTCNMNPRQV